MNDGIGQMFVIVFFKKMDLFDLETMMKSRLQKMIYDHLFPCTVIFFLGERKAAVANVIDDVFVFVMECVIIGRMIHGGGPLFMMRFTANDRVG